MGLFGERGRGRFRKRVKEGLATPSWQVVVAGKTWLCPYCVAAAVKKLPEGEEERVEAILDHLDGDCHAFAGGEGEERPLAELRRAAARRELRRRVKKNLVAHHSWQLVDPRRSWVCPYCGESTGVPVPADRRMTEEVLQGIISHVESCPAWDHGRGQERPHAQLKAALKQQNALAKQIEGVRRKLEGDPAWRRKDARQRWVCPHCLVAQDHIDLSTNLLMFENAPRQIAQHLAQGCEAYRAGVAVKPLEGGLNESGSTRTSSIKLDGVISASETGSVREERPAPALAQPREVREGESGGTRRSGVWGREASEPLPVAPPPPPPPPAERPAERPAAREKEKKGTTLGQLRASGEYTQIDEQERGAAAAGSGKNSSGRQRALRDWRREIERELATVKELSPTLSGEIAAPTDGIVVRARDVHKKLRLAERGYELRVVSVPATPAPRGDFIDVLDLGQDRVGVVVGGLAGDEPEPLIAALARNLLRQHVAPDRSPGEVLQRVNAELFSELDGRAFFAAAVVLLDLPSRRVRLARAGLAAPLLVNPARDPVLAPLECEGLVMGIDKGPVFAGSLEVKALELSPGDTLVLHTNGTLDARPAANREEFGPERMQQLVRRYGLHEVDYLCDKFEEHYEAHHEGMGQRLTDACLVAVKWLGTR